jgi:dTDP-4-amino-4,6-dideoxygalactose transaminase
MTDHAAVPFVDLGAQHATLADEIDAAMRRVTRRGDFILGEDVGRFEEEFAALCGARYAVGVDSGLSALELTLLAFGIGPGDEVVTVSHTFVATASAISMVGATPVFVDVDPRTYTLDPVQLEGAITPRTRAIVPVHLYGQIAAMEAITAIAARHALVVIEDACQAHGARADGGRAGSLAHAGCFSFYPSKNLGAFGDGGMMTTNDAAIAGKVRALRNYGQERKYEHTLLAFNRRLDTLQAAVLRVKLPHLDEWNRYRQSAARMYTKLLSTVPGVVTPMGDGPSHVFHLYVIQVPDRDALMSALRAKDVATGVHYPLPVHLQPCYRQRAYRAGALPVTEALARSVLSLPMYPEIPETSIARVAEIIANVCP